MNGIGSRVASRRRQFRHLLPYVIRSMRWSTIGSMWVAAAALVGLMTWHGSRTDAVAVIRAVTIVLCLGCASVFDDAAAPLTASSPTRLLVRRGHRLIVIVVPLAALTAATFGFVRLRTAQTLPIHALSLELSTLWALTIGAAAIAQRYVNDDRAGTVAAPIVLALVGLSGLLPSKWEFLTVLQGVEETASRHRLWIALTGGVAISLFTSRDVGARSVNRMVRRSRQGSVGFARVEGVGDELGGS